MKSAKILDEVSWNALLWEKSRSRLSSNQFERGEEMGMIIRVAFNNKNWMGKCENGDTDERLFKCQGLDINIGWGEFRVDERGNCQSECRESELYARYLWENYQGNVDTNRASGETFFVFPHVDNSLVLWARSRVQRTENNMIYFERFDPMPEDRWIEGLRAIDFLGKKWGQGTYRYLDEVQTERLMDLIS